jgi:hypothetical protein
VAEHGTGEPHPRILLAGGHHDRRIGLERAIDRADRIAQPRRDMDVGNGGAVRGLRIEARGADRDALVQCHDVLDLRERRQAVEQRRLGGAGIAEDVAHAVGHERFHQHTASTHSQSFSLLSWRILGSSVCLSQQLFCPTGTFEKPFACARRVKRGP